MISPRPPMDALTRAARLAEHGRRATPRYTSYPTAPHFTADLGEETVRAWLAGIDPTTPVSLYVHVPFCREMCGYCGCNMRLVRDDAPIAAYVETLLREIDLVADALPERVRLGHLAFGGGTPTAVAPEDLTRVMERIARRFDVEAGAERAIEADPRTLSPAMAQRLGALGFSRASLGVQEFDAEVQREIRRVQPPEQVAGAVSMLREAGVRSLNFDLLYGLPLQTTNTLLATIDRCATLTPDRVSLFGYAHVPWKASNQKLIRTDRLPGPAERADQAARAAERLEALGYVAVGLDHFALPGDALARAAADGTLRRNFQGYTTDRAETLLAVGTTGIGRTPGGYLQNHPGLRHWRRDVEAGRLPVARGLAFAGDDRLRGAAIERLMCFGELDCAALGDDFGAAADWAGASIAALAPLRADGIVDVDGPRVRIAPWARSLTRLVAAAFDGYLDDSPGRHAASV